MKKQFLSILALILCLCTVFVLASCGKQNDTNESGSDESLNESLNSTDKNGDDKYDVEDGLKDVDAVTAEGIFTQMKEAYKNTVDYKNAYTVKVNWTENQTDVEIGKGGEATKSKYVTTETLTADPTTGKAASILTSEKYEDDTKTSSETQKAKTFTENNKNYLFSTEITDGETMYEICDALSSYGFAAQKNEMLLNSFFGANSHFAESFGDPFSAASASDLKSVNNTVINEVKANQKVIYESQGYIVEQIAATANIIINKEGAVNILKRTITISCSLKNETGTETQTLNLTVESLLKSKDGKILSFVSTSTKTSNNKVDNSDYQTEMTSSLSYDFSYALDSKTYDSIKASAPTTEVVAPDYFSIPLSFYVNGNEVAVNVRGQASDSNSVATILENTINDLFANPNIEYDGKWYTDATCTKELNISSINTIEKLQGIKKLYNASFKANGNCAIFVDSGKETVNIAKNYNTVFGAYEPEGILDAKAYEVAINGDSAPTVSYDPIHGVDVTIKLNGNELKYDENPDLSDFFEQPTGEFTAELIVNGGQIYFINRSNVVTKNIYTLESYFVRF
jgi:hypothetical protein